MNTYTRTYDDGYRRCPCGRRFEPGHHQHIYCTQACRKTHAHKRQTAARQAKTGTVGRWPKPEQV